MDRIRRPETGETREIREPREVVDDAGRRTAASLSELAKRHPIAWQDLERLERKLKDRDVDPAEHTRLNYTKSWRMSRERPDLPNRDQREVASIAIEFGENPARVEELVTTG